MITNQIGIVITVSLIIFYLITFLKHSVIKNRLDETKKALDSTDLEAIIEKSNLLSFPFYFSKKFICFLELLISRIFGFTFVINVAYIAYKVFKLLDVQDSDAEFIYSNLNISFYTPATLLLFIIIYYLIEAYMDEFYSNWSRKKT